MKYGIYMYYDRVAESYVQPLLSISRNDEAAVRDFVAMLLNEAFPKDKRIGDYDLVRLASYDVVLNRVCEVVADPTGNPLCTGVQVRAMKTEIERKRKLGLLNGDEAERSEDAAPSASDSAADLSELELVNDA